MKKRNVIILGALLLAMGLSLIFPVKYYFADKTIPRLPAYNGYNEVILKRLPDSVMAYAAKHHCSGNLVPVQGINGKNELLSLFPSLKEDINLALAHYPNWKLRANDREIAEMKNRLNNNLKKWGNVINPQDILNIIKTQSVNDIHTRYLVRVELLELKHAGGNNLKLIVEINDIKTQNQVFKTELAFVNPVTLKQWKQARQKRIQKLRKLKHRSDAGLVLFLVFSGLLVLFLFYLLASRIIHTVKEKREKNYILQEMQKCQDLANKGHYVAAYQLVEKYLRYFPNDSEAIAFKERLLDFTNGDPKKAQEAFVEAEKMKFRLKQAGENPLKATLSPGEKEHLQALLPYHPELKSSYLALVSGEEKARHEQQLKEKTKALQQLLEAGKIYEARQLLRKTKQEGFESPETDHIEKEINEKTALAEEKWNGFIQMLANGETASLKNNLIAILNEFPDFPAATAFHKQMLEATGKTRFLLKPQDNTGKTIAVLSGNTFILGRNDEDRKPDIAFDDKRVSRQHCRISLSEGKPVVEDLGSTGGTYVNGDKISKRKLVTGDLLNLARLVDLDISLFNTKEGEVGGILLSAVNTGYLLLFSSVSFSVKKGTFSPGNPKYAFTLVENAILFTSREKAVFLNYGEKLNFNNHNYTVNRYENE